jgi:hypothetical protein
MEAVIRGDLVRLILIAKHDSNLLLKKWKVTAFCNSTFSYASAYQLILFYCDKDMKDKIMGFFSVETEEIRRAQEEEMAFGGNDLVKLDRNPLEIARQDFKKLITVRKIFTTYGGSKEELSFPLLENPDGIIYYKDPQDQEHFYYANQLTKEIVELHVALNSQEDKKAWSEFKASFTDMQANSGRRSSDIEHQLIGKLLFRQLQRRGIQYELNGIVYTNNRSEFSLINACRICISLYENGEREKAYLYWNEVVGKAQREVIWLLQRICEENRPFFPLPIHFNGFKRGDKYYDFSLAQRVSLFEEERLVSTLGSFALFKMHGHLAGCSTPPSNLRLSELVSTDLVAICRLVEEAKISIVNDREKNQIGYR